ncbi:MAG TPA: hypothetical protein VFT50_17730 [Baekduia sp.]|nr:hypothetical protein [Baekduia sp.]
MTPTDRPSDDLKQRQRQLKREERQGWVMLVGGFAAAGLLVLLASVL